MSWLLIITSIILETLKGHLSGKPGEIVNIAGALARIAKAANDGYQAEVGAPLDLAKVPPEELIP